MELPSWLKIENLTGKLNLSGWFRYEKKENSIVNNFNLSNTQIILSLDANESPKFIEKNEIPVQEVTKKSDFKFSDSEKFIIDSINQIHRLNSSSYDFSVDYGQALEHLQKKAPSDWFMTVALHMANAIQSGDTELGLQKFFNYFQLDDDTRKIEEFIVIQEKIKYSYKRLQNMRHADKSGELKEHMISQYRRIIHEQDKIPDDDCHLVFIDFQNLLMNLFKNYKLKEL